jgi:hypothetical protein
MSRGVKGPKFVLAEGCSYIEGQWRVGWWCTWRSA